MITAQGGNKDWFSERAFHPITASEHKGSPSKLPVAESLTCLEAKRRRGERRVGSQAISLSARLSAEFSSSAGPP